MRNTILQVASASVHSQQFDKDLLRLFCVLAQQCSNNEYTFACTIQEKELAELIASSHCTNALESEESIPELWLVAATCVSYFPLASLPAAKFAFATALVTFRGTAGGLPREGI